VQCIVSTLGATGGTHPLESSARNVLQLVELGANLLGAGPRHAEHVDVAGVAIARDAPLDDADDRSAGIAVFVLGAGKHLHVVAHHALAEARSSTQLALGRKTHARVGGAIGQPEQDQLGLRGDVQIPDPALDAGRSRMDHPW
jgi:hypothetical protein